MEIYGMKIMYTHSFTGCHQFLFSSFLSFSFSLFFFSLFLLSLSLPMCLSLSIYLSLWVYVYTLVYFSVIVCYVCVYFQMCSISMCHPFPQLLPTGSLTHSPLSLGCHVIGILYYTLRIYVGPSDLHVLPTGLSLSLSLSPSCWLSDEKLKWFKS